METNKKKVAKRKPATKKAVVKTTEIEAPEALNIDAGAVDAFKTVMECLRADTPHNISGSVSAVYQLKRRIRRRV